MKIVHDGRDDVSCGAKVTMIVRDANYDAVQYVCQRHLEWAKARVAATGRLPMLIPQRPGEITSGCRGPRHG